MIQDLRLSLLEHIEDRVESVENALFQTNLFSELVRSKIVSTKLLSFKSIN